MIEVKLQRCRTCQSTMPRTLEFFVSEGPKRGCRPSTLCKKCHTANTKALHKKKRLQALQHYSGKQIPECQCCREQTIEFLTFDHINGGGNKHRATIGKKDLVYWLVKEKFPPGFRVLCQNCNSSLGFHGYCPHQKPSTTTA